MATSKSQRIGVFVIAAVMAIGTLFSFYAIILQNSNAQIDAEKRAETQKELEAEYDKYNEEVVAYQAKVQEEDAKVLEEYGHLLREYQDRPAKFDADKVDELKTEDLVKGDGKTVESSEDMRAYYIGWNKDGKVFDGSIDQESDEIGSPLYPGTGAIQGWLDGVVGMKIGGVRELTIPSELAYGDQEVGDDIPANSPLKFIIVAVPLIQTPEPEMSEKLQDLLGQYQQQ